MLLAVAGSLIFTYVPQLQQLSGGWSVILITVAVSAAAAWLFPITEEEEEELEK